MSHQALARKYRPRTFSEATGQEHVSDTLRRAVSGSRVAHAYLFCGPRGVGKTTLARVLAMALNCPDRTADGEPCGVCDSCDRIWSGHTALDVVEIDAASNRGVDDARDLRERAMYAPSEEGRFKVYIVDEAHMLTREAWNALLKILEEPPPRVIFVFATTEPQKIQQSAAPILSRCQRFDFRRIGVNDIAVRLAEVLKREGMQAPEESLVTIARKADGGMRDGLSLLDQVLSLSGGEIDAEAVRRVLGLVAEERYLQLFAILTEGRHGDVFGFVQELLDEGYDLVEFYHGLVDALRTLLRVKLSPDADIPELPEHLRDDFVAAVDALRPGDLVRMLSLASELEATGSLRRSGHPRFLLEMLLLRLSYLDRTVELEELLSGLGGAPSGDPLRAPGEPAPTPPREADRPAAAPVTAGAATPPSEPVSAVDTAPAPTPEPADPPDPDEDLDEDPPGPQPPFESLAEAWVWLTSGPGRVGGGMGTLLAAADVTEPEPGRIRVRIGPPALDRLEDADTHAALESALATALGRSVTVVALPPDSAGSAGRITQENVQEGRIRELIREEPLLEHAVQELDLELIE